MPEYLFLLSGEHESLAKAEVKAKHPNTTWQDLTKAMIGKIEQAGPETLAFTKAIYLVHQRGDQDDIQTWAKKHPLTVTETVKVERVALERQEPPAATARQLIIPWLGRPPVDLTSPQRTFALITTSKEWAVAEQVWRNNEDFQARKNQYRPAPHPTSLHPKLARAMINLANPKKSVLDPFCGSGGILIEAGLMGLTCEGTDIDEGMIARAAKNLQHFGVKANLSVKDALENDNPAEAIVTDMPYGRNSKATDLERLYDDFLAHAAKQTKNLIIAFPSINGLQAIIEQSAWKALAHFSWRLHKSLNKEIYVLERKFK